MVELKHAAIKQYMPNVRSTNSTFPLALDNMRVQLKRNGSPRMLNLGESSYLLRSSTPIAALRSTAAWIFADEHKYLPSACHHNVWLI